MKRKVGQRERPRTLVVDWTGGDECARELELELKLELEISKEVQMERSDAYLLSNQQMRESGVTSEHPGLL